MGSLQTASSVTIPTVDLSPFFGESSVSARKQAASELLLNARINGCVGITGHGLGEQAIRSAFDVVKTFFALPPTEKTLARNPNMGIPPRGFTEAGIEHVGHKEALEAGDEQERNRLAKLSDFKETYDISSEASKEQANVWLPEDVLPGFRSFMVDFYYRLDTICQILLDAFMMALELSEEECLAIKKIHDGDENQLRLAHYLPFPKVKLDDQEVTRLAAHHDWSSFTLLLQDVHAGLEFQNRQTGQFMLAPPRGELLYLNVGDMLERLSNGLFPSSIHRVAVAQPTGDETSEFIPSRFSIPYFFQPCSDGLVMPQKSLVKKDGKARYEPLTFKEHSDRLFQLARGSQKAH